MAEIRYTDNLEGVDWTSLKTLLKADDFDNGRTPEQLRDSFANSEGVCFAWDGQQVIGKGRVLSDGVCNAYLVDLWTYSPYRNQGIARAIAESLVTPLVGQHVYLQADDDKLAFYSKLGFRPQPNGMSRVIGEWLGGS